MRDESNYVDDSLNQFKEGIQCEVKGQDEINDLFSGMTLEEILPEYYDQETLKEQPEPVYRLDSSGHRYYYTFDENSNPRFFVSVTTLIRQTTPTSPELIKWIANMGYDESQRYASERASYGTFMHSQIADLIINRSYDLNKLKSRLKDYIESEQLPADFINYADDLKKDILAFAQFMRDTDLKPLAIELVLTNPEDGYAGAIDLAAEIEIEEKGFFGETYKSGENKGKPKESKRKRRVTAIIDFKSGRKGFFPEYEIQLHAYKAMWDLHFPELPIEKLYNWSPKDWRGLIPTYNLKDQTDSKNASKLPYLIELARIEDSKRDNTIVACGGVIDLNSSNGLDLNIIEMSLSEAVIKRHFKDDPVKNDENANKSEISDDQEKDEESIQIKEKTPEKPKKRGRKPGKKNKEVSDEK